MNSSTGTKPQPPDRRRIDYAIAFAFGLGATFGIAVSSWITAMLGH